MKRSGNKVFGRQFQQRKAFTKGLLTALVAHGRIRTTEARAKMLKREADRIITTAKKGTTHGRRLLLRRIGADAARKVTAQWAPKFASRSGGYTRVVKLGRRASDGSPVAIVEFLS